MEPFNFSTFETKQRLPQILRNFINFLRFTLVRSLHDLVRLLISQVNVRFDHFWRFQLQWDFLNLYIKNTIFIFLPLSQSIYLFTRIIMAQWLISYSFRQFSGSTLVSLLVDLVRLLISQVNVRFDHIWRLWRFFEFIH